MRYVKVDRKMNNTEMNYNKTIVIISGLMIVIGLIARDLLGISMNKIVFLFLVGIPILLVNLEWLVVFLFFVIPLYVGLPGNFISIFVFSRMLFEIINKQIVLSTKGFVLSLLVAAYVLIQNSITGNMSIYNIMAAFDFIILFFLMSASLQQKVEKKVVLAFLLGVTCLGIIMIGAALRYFSLSELMNPATRLGNSGLLIKASGTNMIISIDPNFYSMNVLAAVSSGWLLFESSRSRRERNIIILLVACSITLCLFTLSRTFVLLLVIWILLCSLGRINTKTIAFLVGVCVLFFLFINAFPIVVDGFLSRFSENNLSGGNGRVDLIKEYFDLWLDNTILFFFGMGIFNCNTHCTPLQYLFGLGIIGSVPLFGWFFYNWSMCKQQIKKISFRLYAPIIVTFIFYATLPAVGSINYTIPILVTMLSITLKNDNEIEYIKKDEYSVDSRYMR